MSAKVFRLLLAASLLLSSGGAFAAQPVGSVSPAFKQKLALSESKLKAIEGKTAAILRRKTITVADENIGKELDAYAEQMQGAIEEAEKSGTSFKATAQAHADKIDNLIKKFEEIDNKVTTGDIALDKAVLKKMSPAALDELKKSLAPQGLQKMQKLHPDIFTSMSSFDGESIVYAVEKNGSLLIDGIGGFFSVRDADASSCPGKCYREWQQCRRGCKPLPWYKEIICRCRCFRKYLGCLLSC